MGVASDLGTNQTVDHATQPVARRPRHEPPEIEDAEFVEVPAEAGAMVRASGAQTRLVETGPTSERETLVHNPRMRMVAPNKAQVIGKFEDSRIFAWGFWGGFMAVATLLALLVFRGPTGLHNTTEWLVVLGLVGLGGIMFKWGPRDNLRIHPLLVVDGDRQELRWPVHVNGDMDRVANTELAVAFEDVTEIVFGMIYAPLSRKQPDARVHAFTLLVRDRNDQLIPVIEASPNKKEVFEIANQLSATTGANITQVGEGIRP